MIWLAACVAVFLLVTRTGVRLTLDCDRKMVRQEARIGGVPQVRELPFGTFPHVTVTFDHAEWETWGSTRNTGSGRATKHVSPVLVFKVALDGGTEVPIESFHVVRAAERRAVELAHLQFVGPGEELGTTEDLAVGTLRIRAVKGEAQQLSMGDWPKDETQTIPVIVPKRQ